jgi:hypothetical protein
MQFFSSGPCLFQTIKISTNFGSLTFYSCRQDSSEPSASIFRTDMLGSEAGGANACRVKGDETRFKIPEQGAVYTLLKGCRRQLLNIPGAS